MSEGGKFGSFKQANFDLLLEVGFFGFIGEVVFRGVLVFGGWSPILSNSTASNVSVWGSRVPIGQVGGF